MSQQVARVALLGSGTVGLAVLRRLAGWQGSPIGELRGHSGAGTIRAVAGHPAHAVAPLQGCEPRVGERSRERVK